MKRFTIGILMILAAGMIMASTAAKDLYLPAASRATGAFGTDWKSDVRVFNPNTAAATVNITYMPMAQWASQAATITVTVGAGETLVMENILEVKFGLTPNTAGALHFVSNVDIYVESRVFTPNKNDLPGTFGQRIPGIPASQAVAAGESVDILYVDNYGDETSGFRTNFGLVDAGGAGVAYTLTAYGHDGAMLGTTNGTVGTNQWDQFNALGKFNLSNNQYARLVLAVTSGKAIPYASQADNASGDAMFVDGTKIKASGGGGGTGCVEAGAYEGYTYLIEHDYADLMNAPFSVHIEDGKLLGFYQFYFLWVGTSYYWAMYADEIYLETPVALTANTPFTVTVAFKWLNSNNAECLQETVTVNGTWDGCSYASGTASLLAQYLGTCGDTDWRDAQGKFTFSWEAGVNQSVPAPSASKVLPQPYARKDLIRK